MTEEQADGLADVEATFSDHVVDHEETADGGLLVTVRQVPIGAGWNRDVIDLAVKLQVTFPSSMPTRSTALPASHAPAGRASVRCSPASTAEAESCGRRSR